MEKLYKEILKKYNDNEYVIKSRLNETKIEKLRYSYLAKEYMVFLWMKENNDDRWKQMIKTILLPNNLVCDTANLDITEIMNFIGKTDKDYTDESVISLFLDKIEKVETKEVEEDYFQIEDEETFEVKVVEPKDEEDDVFFEILEEITEEKPKEEPKKEVKKRTKKAVKPVEVKIEETVESVIEEPVVEVVSTIEEEVKSVVQTESECENPTPYHTLFKSANYHIDICTEPTKDELPSSNPRCKRRTQDVNTNEYSESITIDRYVYKLIENVEDKTKYIETLILKDLFSK